MIAMTWHDMREQAEVLVKSGLVPVKSPEAAIAITLKGREVGFGPMESFELINVIQGRPTITPKGQLVQVYRSGLLESISIKDDGNTCTVTMVRKGGARHTASFSMDDARRAGLLNNDNWRKYPKQMRQWRAIGYCCDVLFPDLTGGCMRPEEFGAIVNEEGSPIGNHTTPTPDNAPPAFEDAQDVSFDPFDPADTTFQQPEQPAASATADDIFELPY